MAEVKVSGKEILTLLEAGYTRYEKDVVEGVNPGSVEKKLGLTGAQLKEFLKHPKLANFRYKPKATMVDDFGDTPVLVDDFSVAPAVAPAPVEAAPTPRVAPIVAATAVEEKLEEIMENADAKEQELFA